MNEPITNWQRMKTFYEAGRICRVVERMRNSNRYNDAEIAAIIGEIYEVDGKELIIEAEALRYV